MCNSSCRDRTLGPADRAQQVSELKNAIFSAIRVAAIILRGISRDYFAKIYDLFRENLRTNLSSLISKLANPLKRQKMLIRELIHSSVV